MTDEIKAKPISPGEVVGIFCYFSNTFSINNTNKIALVENLSTDIISQLLLDETVVGVVSKTGGLTSHGAALLREKKIPCVVLLMSDSFIELDLYLEKEIQVDGVNGLISGRKGV